MSKNPPSFQEFLKSFPIRRVRKGQIILYQGEAPRNAFVIKDGVVKSYNLNPLGEEKIITFNVAADLIPLAWIFEKAPGALYYYDAFTDCELYSLPKDELRKFMTNDQATANFLLDRYITLYVGSSLHINALEQSKSTEKIIRTLQHLVMRYGEEQGKNLWRINLRLTHQDLANMIGLTRETVAMELSKLKKRGIVSYFGQRYMVKTETLQQILGEDTFKDLDI